MISLILSEPNIKNIPWKISIETKPIQIDWNKADPCMCHVTYQQWYKLQFIAKQISHLIWMVVCLLIMATHEDIEACQTDHEILYANKLAYI